MDSRAGVVSGLFTVDAGEILVSGLFTVAAGEIVGCAAVSVVGTAGPPQLHNASAVQVAAMATLARM